MRKSGLKSLFLNILQPYLVYMYGFRFNTLSEKKKKKKKQHLVLRNGLNRAYCSVSARLQCQF